MIQQGQVFKLKATSVDGEPLWAYRYRVAGRDSVRRQVGGFCDQGGGAEGTSEQAGSALAWWPCRDVDARRVGRKSIWTSTRVNASRSRSFAGCS